MKNHSMIFDDFFEDPMLVRGKILERGHRDVPYRDGVTYPNVSELPYDVENEALANLEKIFGPITMKLAFARYSFADTEPPHWAHSDREIAQYLALIYMSEGGVGETGTAVVRHKQFGFETHPSDPTEQTYLLRDANDRNRWQITYVCPSRFNRLFVLSADLVHAAMGEYGKTKEDGRLVLSIFFDVGR